MDEAWLSLGIAPNLQPQEQRVHTVALRGAVHLLAGAVQMDGGAVAFPTDGDPRADHVSLYAIIRGAQYSMYAALADETKSGAYRFTIPVDYLDSMVIGVIAKPGLQWDFLLMESALIDAHKASKGGYYEVDVTHGAKGYASGKDVWPRIETVQRETLNSSGASRAFRPAPTLESRRPTCY